MPMTCATFAYPRLDSSARSTLVARLADTAVSSETFFLSTCLRVEVAAPVDAPSLVTTLGDIFKGTTVPTPLIRSDQQAATHLFRVAAGLESPIVGEQEVLTQFRRAVAVMVEAGSIDGRFAKLLQAAVNVGRRARQLLPLLPHQSMGHVAADLVAGSDRVAVLGAGDMAMAVIGRLVGLADPPKLTLLARRPEHVTVETVNVWGFDRLGEVLASHPTVISATSAATRLLSRADMAVILDDRPDPLTLIDMAMPPDFEPPPHGRVDHHDIDDLARAATTQVETANADAFVDRTATEAYRRHVLHGEVGPLIGRLMDEADGIVDQTVVKFRSRLSEPGDEKILRQVAYTVARTILARPVSHLSNATGAEADIEVIARAFRLTNG